MKVGTDQIRYEVLKICKKYNAYFKGISRGGFADELTASIQELIGDDMNKGVKTMVLARGGDPAVVKMCERVERAFGFDLMTFTEKDQEVYKFLIEMDARGQTIERFAEWARHPDRSKYIRKYRNDTSNIRNEWKAAFGDRTSLLRMHQ